MQYIKERIDNIVNTLDTLKYEQVYQIENYEIVSGNFLNKETAGDSFKSVDKDHKVSGFDTHFAVSFKASIPDSFAGKTVALCVSGADISERMELQMLLYIDGELKQGLDPNHVEHIFTYDAKQNETHDFFVNCYTGRNTGSAKLDIKLVVVNEVLRDLYFNIITLKFIAEKLDTNSIEYVDIIKVLNDTINLIDLRESDCPEFFESLAVANNFIKEEYYDKHCVEGDVIASCVGHTHIDVAYLWTVAQTREKVLRSFSTVLDLMDKYPEYIFMSSQPVLYEFVKEQDPVLYAKIKQRVAEGRWEVEGGMYVEADCNVTSGESLVRQFLYGKRFFKEEFGKDNEVLWLPDVFGYSAALPQILKKSDINYFMTTKISWNQTNKIPFDTFMWKGIDGSEVLTHFITTTDPDQDPKRHYTTYNGMLHPKSVVGAWDRYQQKNINKDVLIAFGFGDGGGGANYEMLEVGRRMSKGIKAAPTVKMTTSNDYFKKLEKTVSGNKKLPKWIGELYLEFHRGTYTSMARNKRDNRKCEIGYTDLEKILSFASSVGVEYDNSSLPAAWKKILLNQFHDILPGSSIKDVYEVTKEEYKELLDGLYITEVLDALSEKIYAKTNGILAFNTTSFERNSLVEVSSCVASKLFDINEVCSKNITFTDDDGNIFDAQVTFDGNVLILDENFPSMGYKVYYYAGVSENQQSLNLSKDSFENDFVKVSLNEKGQITSMIDKRQNRQILKDDKVCNELRVFEDRPMKYNNWDIDIYYKEKSWEVSNVTSAEIIENGNLRCAIKYTFEFMSSSIEQVIYFYKNTSRIDFKTDVDWDQSQLLLKTIFPVDVNNTQAHYEIQYGNIKRATTSNNSWDKAQFEVVSHKWADFSETGFGVALLNDSKYGHSIKDEKMEISLVKSGIYPNPTTDREHHNFTYSLFTHEGDYTNGVIDEAYDLNYKIHSTFINENANGEKVSSSFVTSDKNNIIVEVVKQSEDKKDTIIRLYDSQNTRTNVNLKFAKTYKSITLTNLLEENQQVICENCNEVNLDVKAFEIITLRLED